MSICCMSINSSRVQALVSERSCRKSAPFMQSKYTCSVSEAMGYGLCVTGVEPSLNIISCLVVSARNQIQTPD